MGIESAVGGLLRGVRAGREKLVANDPGIASAPQTLEVTSVFEDEGMIPAIYTVDGDRGSPALTWSDCGERAASYAVIIEDVDVPLPQPLVHGIAYNISPDMTTLPENAIPRDGQPVLGAMTVGRNSMGSQTFLPPSPIRGHGVHRYVFQVFALDCELHADDPMHLGDLREQIAGHVVARGCLTGTYMRE